jgi:membrane-bound inhibitor of C-type lysozyme
MVAVKIVLTAKGVDLQVAIGLGFHPETGASRGVNPMRGKFIKGLFCGTVLVACVEGCGPIIGESVPAVLGGTEVEYRCGNGERIVARYYSLSDHSLDFVKVLLPDGREYTLPQVVSGSGVRYSTDRDLVWWTKGDSAFAEVRGPEGDWRIKYDKCREIPEEQGKGP